MAAPVSSVGRVDVAEPHRAHVVALGVDVSHFREFTESIEPEVLIDVLSEFQSMIGMTVTPAGGYVVNFAGDSMLVVFNDPIEVNHPEMRAVGSAIQIRDAAAILVAGWRRRGFPLGFRLGLDAGFATIGRVGFPGRYEYGVLGRTVINAFMLLRAAGEGQIVASGRLASALDETIETRALGNLEISGLARPLSAVEVVGLR